ncbi:hypothetical protein IWQ62_002828 [Dispira parvispora]|uniref:Uncharacterized protein n=1 Tax=Dispira parvispora TaxID=1520584 RepID=A0A9W8AQI6_9FUNG|nr:hypothetical protein IWQ62_002828 [Dispira parvispora]
MKLSDYFKVKKPVKESASPTTQAGKLALQPNSKGKSSRETPPVGKPSPTASDPTTLPTTSSPPSVKPAPIAIPIPQNRKSVNKPPKTKPRLGISPLHRRTLRRPLSAKVAVPSSTTTDTPPTSAGHSTLLTVPKHGEPRLRKKRSYQDLVQVDVQGNPVGEEFTVLKPHRKKSLQDLLRKDLGSLGGALPTDQTVQYVPPLSYSPTRRNCYLVSKSLSTPKGHLPADLPDGETTRPTIVRKHSAYQLIASAQPRRTRDFTPRAVSTTALSFTEVKWVPPHTSDDVDQDNPPLRPGSFLKSRRLRKPATL